jgi:hypothetical protein
MYYNEPVDCNTVNNMKKLAVTTFLLSLASAFLAYSPAMANSNLDWELPYLDAPTTHEYSFASLSQQASDAAGSSQASYGPDYTNLPRKIRPLDERAFIFSPKLQRWAAYDEYGYKVAGGIANGGADFCEELNEPCRTPVGKFRVTRKKGVECESSQFPVGEGGAAMPYCMFFKAGNAIHGSPQISTENSSHGCIRVLTGAAQWLNHNFLDIGTRVITLPY